MNVLDDLAVWLASTSTGSAQFGPGVSTAMPVYKGKMPASTGNFYVLYQYAGLQPERLLNMIIDKPRVQVLTLSNSTVDNGYAAALTAGNRLRFITNTYLPSSSAGNFYIEVSPLASPESLGMDETGRMHWYQNFQIQVTY